MEQEVQFYSGKTEDILKVLINRVLNEDDLRITVACQSYLNLRNVVIDFRALNVDIDSSCTFKGKEKSSIVVKVFQDYNSARGLSRDCLFVVDSPDWKEEILHCLFMRTRSGIYLGEWFQFSGLLFKNHTIKKIAA